MEMPTKIGAGAYAEKSVDYFDSRREDFVNRLPKNKNSHVLEIGCGTGGTGDLALTSGKYEYYAGVEISSPAAAIAKRYLSGVIVGDIKSIELPWPQEHFDALLMSEVLEHLVDPWSTLLRLTKFLKPGL